MSSVYCLWSSCTTLKLALESSLRRCCIPVMPASATAIAAASTEPPNSASPPTTCPRIIMITAASRAAGMATSSSSASSVTAITALADLPGVCSSCQSVITPTSLAPEYDKAVASLQQHDMSCPLVVNAPIDQDVPAAARDVARNPLVASLGSRAVLCTGTRISPWLLRNSGVPNRSARTGVPVTRRKTFACLAASTAAAACALTALQGTANAAAPAPASKHVLLISVDGMHQSDLDWYVAHHPSSTLAKLLHTGSEYTNASTSNPSDSDPGGTALMTGGNPKSTGVYY